MTTTSKESASDREILLVGPYGVLGTGVIDAVAANPAWRITTAARRHIAPKPHPATLASTLWIETARSRHSRIWIL